MRRKRSPSPLSISVPQTNIIGVNNRANWSITGIRDSSSSQAERIERCSTPGTIEPSFQETEVSVALQSDPPPRYQECVKSTTNFRDDS